MMNDNFYRNKKAGIRLLRQSLPSVLRRWRIWRVGIVCVLLVFVLFGNRGVLQRINLEAEKKRIIERLQDAEQETIHLREQLRRVANDDSFIEKIARERYGMIRSGETIYRIAED